MIYQTIPVRYIDHADFLKAIIEANVLIGFAMMWAEQGLECLMQDNVTSGEAVYIGRFINYAKNIEYGVNQWLNTLCEIAGECNIIIPDDLVDNDVGVMYAKKLNTERKDNQKSIINQYSEWTQQLLPLSKKYKFMVRGAYMNFSNNGEAERRMVRA